MEQHREKQTEKQITQWQDGLFEFEILEFGYYLVTSKLNSSQNGNIISRKDAKFSKKDKKIFRI
jgi:hypothetical protein